MFPRRLLPDERHILEVLLSRPFEGRDELVRQAQSVKVIGPSCACGCPSIALQVDRASPPSKATGPVADGFGIDGDGNHVGVGLFVDEAGYMYDLDVWALGDDIHGRPTLTAHGRPTVESFEVAEWEPTPDGNGATLKNPPGSR